MTDGDLFIQRKHIFVKAEFSLRQEFEEHEEQLHREVNMAAGCVGAQFKSGK